MRKITKINKLKFVTFAHIERETSIVEVLHRGKIVFDVSFKNDNASNAIEILFFKDIDGLIFKYPLGFIRAIFLKEIANEYFDGKFSTTLDLSKGFPNVSLVLGHHYDFKSCESYTGKNYLMNETEVEGTEERSCCN